MPGAIACRLCGRDFVPAGRGPPRYCTPCRRRAARESVRALRAKCKECGAAFSTTNRSVRYCSDQCRKKGFARYRDAPRRPRRSRDGPSDCRVCGREFTPGKASGNLRVYCSAACRAEGMRTKGREYMRRHLSDPRKRAIWSARANAAASRRVAERRRRRSQ